MGSRRGGALKPRRGIRKGRGGTIRRLLGRRERRDPTARGTAETRLGGPSDGTINRSEGHGCRLPRTGSFPGLAPQATMVIPTNGITCAYQLVRQATIGSVRWLIGL